MGVVLCAGKTPRGIFVIYDNVLYTVNKWIVSFHKPINPQFTQLRSYKKNAPSPCCCLIQDRRLINTQFDIQWRWMPIQLSHIAFTLKPQSQPTDNSVTTIAKQTQQSTTQAATSNTVFVFIQQPTVWIQYSKNDIESIITYVNQYRNISIWKTQYVNIEKPHEVSTRRPSLPRQTSSSSQLLSTANCTELAVCSSVFSFARLVVELAPGRLPD